MSGIRVEGNTSGNVAEVDDSGNLLATLPYGSSLAKVGFATLAAERDLGLYTGTRNIERLAVSAQGRLVVGQPIPLFQEVFNGTALNTGVFASPTTTATVTVAGGFLNLNASALTTANAVAQVSTRAWFPLFESFALKFVAEGQLTQPPQVNNVMEIGLFIATGTAAPTDGLFFRYDAAGNLKAVASNNGTEVMSAIITFPAAISPSTRIGWAIEVTTDVVRYFVNATLVAEIPVGTGVGQTFLAESLPFSVREYNSASVPPLAQTLKIASVYIGWQDAAGAGIDYRQILALGGRAHQGQTGGTMGTIANYANSANPTAAVPTNTTAALGSGLGGQFWETATLALNTDGVISSFQNPAGTAAISGKTLLIYGVKIESYIQTAIAGGPFNKQWSLAFGHTAVSLATPEAATTKAPRRVPLGVQTVVAAQAVNTVLSTVNVTFATPIPVYPGEFVQTVTKHVGTVGTAGVIAHVITIDHCFF